MPRAPHPETADDVIRSLHHALVHREALFHADDVRAVFSEQYIHDVLHAPKVVMELCRDDLLEKPNDDISAIEFTSNDPVLIIVPYWEEEWWDVIWARVEPCGNINIKHYMWGDRTWVVTFDAVMPRGGHDIEIRWRTSEGDVEEKTLDLETVKEGKNEAIYAVAALRVAMSYRLNDEDGPMVEITPNPLLKPNL